MNYLLVLTRAIHFGAVLWLFGEFVLFVFVIEPALRGVSSNPSVDTHEPAQRLVRVAGWCVAIAVASACAWLLLEAASMSGMPLAVAINRQTLETIIGETLFGHIWMCRLAISLSLIALLCLAWRQQRRRQGAMLQFVGTFLAGAYAATLAWTGHAAADAGADKYIHLGSDALHVLAAGAWVGALPGLISLLNRAGDSPSPERLALTSSAARRFSTMGLATVSALAVTGLVNASYLVGSIAALLGTGYGRLLLCKLLLFAVMVTLAAVNRLHATPQLTLAAQSATGAAARDALARLRSNALLEIAGGAMIVGIVAVLGLTMPAAHMLHHEHPAPMTSERHDH